MVAVKGRCVCQPVCFWVAAGVREVCRGIYLYCRKGGRPPKKPLAFAVRWSHCMIAEDWRERQQQKQGQGLAPDFICSPLLLSSCRESEICRECTRVYPTRQGGFDAALGGRMGCLSTGECIHVPPKFANMQILYIAAAVSHSGMAVSGDPVRQRLVPESKGPSSGLSWYRHQTSR